MKKTQYLPPYTEVLNIEPVAMLAGSIINSLDPSTPTEPAKSRDFDFSDQDIDHFFDSFQ